MTEEQYRQMLAAMAKRVEEHPDIAEAGDLDTRYSVVGHL